MKEVVDYISSINTRIVFSSVILFCVIAYWMFKNKPEGKYVFGFIRWVFVSYGLITAVGFFNHLSIYNSRYQDAFVHLMMIVLGWLLPLSLIGAKFGKSYRYILLVSIFIQFQMSFERLVIIITSLHRDYIFDTYQDTGNLPFIVSSIFVALEFTAMGYVLVLAFNSLLKKLKPS